MARSWLGWARIVLALALAAASAPAAAEPRPDPVVQTADGAVRGVAGPDLDTFKAIPFAAPPVGPLRWRPPQPAQPWSGVRDAARFGADCMQIPYMVNSGQPFSEDCLTLNIWRPAAPAAGPRPVMVFIYGGAFLGGSTGYGLYDGSALARRGVVVVSLNYRVGIFGFLAHPGLSAESPDHASGNYGLMDQMAGLAWVKANIAAFGGDPGRVTVFGESAGASSIAILMTAPKARGLFQRAILQSPWLATLPSRAAAERAGLMIGPDIAALRAMKAEDLLARNGVFFARPMRGVAKFAFPSPIVDGALVATQPRAAFQTGAVDAVPTIVGVNADEGRMFLEPSETVTAKSYRAWARATFGPLAPRTLRLTPAADDADARKAKAAVLGDGEFLSGARLIARSVARSQPLTFAYVFTRRPGGGGLPATHSEELPYVFGTLGQPDFTPHGRPGPADQALSGRMIDAWTRFAATSDPNGPGPRVWPAYGPGDPYLDFGDTVRPGRGYRRAQIDVIDQYETTADRASAAFH